MDDGMIGVVGAGLIGGSIALGAQKAGFSVTVYDQYNSATGLNLGAANLWAATIEEVALGSDLIFSDRLISATVTGAEALLIHLKPGTIVSEVASAKQEIAPKLSRLLSPRCQYIPTHPMAGSERSGWEAAQAELFQGAVTVVCNDFCPDANAAAVMRSFWERLGCTPISFEGPPHDSPGSPSRRLPPPPA